MDIDPYLELVTGLPRAAPEQARDFAEYVSDAHSWYKHLPLMPPGEPFFFFLDPNAGRVLTQTANGAMIHHDRLEGWQKFHYNEMTTAEYRRRFGFWQYHCGRGSRFMTGSASRGWDINSTRLEVVDARGGHVAVPQDIMNAGACFLTALVHKHDFGWPVEEWERMVKRYKAWRAENPSDPQACYYETCMRDCADERIPKDERLKRAHDFQDRVKDPRAWERERQLCEMTAAMGRVQGLL